MEGSLVVKRLLKIDYPFGATTLDPNELEGLITLYISSQGELHALEQENIIEAKLWAQNKKRSNEEILCDTFVKKLHLHMFQNVWKWAGVFRLSEKSIGVSWTQIPMELKKLLDDVLFWIEHQSYSWDEIGARFHHRLVLIHPFPNGNGRHARLMTDILLEANGLGPFSWGWNLHKNSLDEDEESMARTEYIAALREADQKKMGRLLRFVRS